MKCARIKENPFIFVKKAKLKLQKHILLILFSGGLYLAGFSQSGQNPFELTPRLPDPVEVIDTAELETRELTKPAGNPFDIIQKPVAPKEEAKKALPLPEKTEKIQPTVGTEKQRPGFLFPTILTILIIATILLTLFRSYITRVYKAVFSDTMLHQLYNDRLNVGLPTAFTPLYLFFFINVGLFIFLTLNHFELLPGGSPFQNLLIITGGTLALFLLKHLILIYLGSVFPIKQEISNYNFTIVVFSIFIGLGLVLLNLAIAYVPKEMTKWLIYTGFIFIGLTYLLRYLRGIFIADKYLQFHKFHFLLYICTVEIAPVLFLYRFFTSQMQG